MFYVRLTLLFTVFLTFNTKNVNAQLKYLLYVNKTLSSDSLAGRGFYQDTQQKAAFFIYNQFDSLGLKPVSSGFQPFSYYVNTFNKKQVLLVDGKSLKPGSEFLYAPENKSFKGKLKPVKKNSIPNYKHFVIFDKRASKNTKETLIEKEDAIFAAMQKSAVVVLKDNLTWATSQNQLFTYPLIETTDSTILIAKNINVNCNANLVKFQSNNVIFKYEPIPNDSITIICAHYDHLGIFGSAIFNGASDNASGVSTMLALAAKIVESKVQKNYVFIAFAAEEVAILGSKYFVESKLVNLSKVKEVINLDILSDPADGVTVVNGKENLPIFNRLTSINDENKFLDKIFIRSFSANSDHFWFAKLNIPAIFIYSNGNYKNYHNVFDRHEVIPFTNQQKLLDLLYLFLIN